VLRVDGKRRRRADASAKSRNCRMSRLYASRVLSEAPLSTAKKMEVLLDERRIVPNRCRHPSSPHP
jgi:hypothetical protein